MNTPQNAAPAPLAETQDSDEIDVIGLLDILLDARWLILSVAAVVLAISVAYVLLTQPIYQADTLIQVEQSQNDTSTQLTELTSLFSGMSPTSAEMEILRSRLVVGGAADALHLYINAAPDYLPFIGQWLARHASGLSNPGFLGMGGYVTGTESIEVTQLDVPKELEGKELKLVASSKGYVLKDPDGRILVNGTVGSVSEFTAKDEPGRIRVASLQAKPGASFTLVRQSRLASIANLQKNLQINEQGKQSGVIAVTLKGPDPVHIMRVLNAVDTEYVKQNVDRKAAEAEKSLSFLSTYLPQLKKKVDEATAKYTKFRDQHGTFDLTTEGGLALNTSVNLQSQLLDLQQKRRGLLAQFTPAHPSVRVVDEQIAALHKKITQVQQRIKKLPDLEQQLLTLMQDVKVNGDMYVNLLNSSQQLKLVKEGKVGNVRVVDPAVTPEKPVWPRRLLVLAIALVLGLVLGAIIAFIRNWLNPGIKDPSDIESALGLHVFATIPHSASQGRLHELAMSKAPGTHVLAEIAPTEPAVESLRSLRTALQFAMLDASNNIVLLTGPTPGIGKSFTSVNFAAILGAAGKRVLLIDADLRKGYINQYFGLERNKGYSELISGSLRAEDAVHKNVLPNVDLITTGIVPPNPAELLLSQSTTQILRELSAQYDIVLLDTSPILAVSDAMALAPHAGTLFLLARAQASTLGELEESAKRLRQAGAHVSGVIFNDLVATNRRYGSKYGNYRYTNYEYGTPG